MAKEKFGAVAMQYKFVTPRQLQEAMVMQVELEDKTGESMLIGEILVKLKYMTREHLEATMNFMTEHEVNAYLKRPSFRVARAELYDKKGVSYYI